MSQSPSISDQVHRYLANELTEEERIAFEQKFVDDPEFAKEASSLFQVEQLIQANSMELRKQEFLRDFSHEVRESKGQIRHISWQYWIAASVVLLLGIGLVFWFSQSSSPPTNQDLFAAYYQPLRVYNERSGIQDDSLLKGAHGLFREGKYEASILAYEEVLQRQQVNDSAQALLFLGFSHLKLGNGQEALDAFQLIRAPGALEHADWYTALTYLQMENLERVKLSLDQIIGSPNHFYQAKAKELREKIQN